NPNAGAVGFRGRPPGGVAAGERDPWRIDHGRADSVWELFVPDGVLATSGTPLTGRDAIRAGGRARALPCPTSFGPCQRYRLIDNLALSPDATVTPSGALLAFYSTSS